MRDLEEEYFDRSFGSVADLITAIARLESQPKWSAGGLDLDRNRNPWAYIRAATLDLGNIRGSAYPTAVTIVNAAVRTRAREEQSVALFFALSVVFDALYGSADIPPGVVDAFCTMLVAVLPTVEACLNSAELKVAQKDVLLASLLLGEQKLVLARIVYEIATTESLILPCRTCSTEITFDYVRAHWRSTHATSVVDSIVCEKLVPIAESAKRYGLSLLLLDVTELGVQTICSECGDRADVWSLAAADVARRCPLARVAGWFVA